MWILVIKDDVVPYDHTGVPEGASVSHTVFKNNQRDVGMRPDHSSVGVVVGDG